MCPGECIIQDRGEFANKICDQLAKKFGCDIRVISAGRPQANGQAEAYVKQLKGRMKAKMVEASQDELPDNWDETLLPYALSVLRSDPSCAHGYAPGELLLGRKLKWPIELEKEDIDMSGTELTGPLVHALKCIHDDVFGKAATKLKKHQENYANQYDKRNKVNLLKLRKGTRVQILSHIYKNGDFPKAKMKVLWKPFRSYYKIHSLDRKKGVVTVRSKSGRVYKQKHPFARVRLFRGKA